MNSYAFNDLDEELVETMTFLLPCRRFDIGHTVSIDRKLPVVDEFLLRLLYVTDGLTLEQLQGYFGFSLLELQRTITPLIDAKYIRYDGHRYILRESGIALFDRSNDGIPRLTQVEFREATFRLDMVTYLPAPYENIAEILDLKSLLLEVPVGGDEDASNSQEKARQSFSKNWTIFLEEKGLLRAMKDRKLKLYKTEYVRAGDFYILPIQVATTVNMRGVGDTKMTQIGQYAQDANRDSLVRLLIEDANQLCGDANPGSIKALCSLSGSNRLLDFCHHNAFNLQKYIAAFANAADVVDVGNEVVFLFGASSTERNVHLLVDVIRRAADDAARSADKVGEERRGSDRPVEIEVTWVRPTRASWARSIEFFHGLEKVKNAASRRSGAQVVCSLAENLAHSTSAPPRALPLRHYDRVFDELMSFRSADLPADFEVILVHGYAVMVLAHSIKPDNSGVFCPIGYFSESKEAAKRMLELLKAGRLRTRPVREKTLAAH